MLSELYSYLFDNAPLPMWVSMRADLSYAEVNNEALKFYGYTKEEFLTLTAFDIRDPSEVQFLKEKKETFEDFKISEAIHRKKNGERVFMEVTGRAIDYLGKEAYLVTAIDISERKKDQKILKTNQELLLTSQKMGKIGSWEILLNDLSNWENNPTILSDEAYRIFGSEPGSGISFNNFLKKIHPEDLHKIMGRPEDFFNSSKSPQSHHSEYRIILADGTQKHIYGIFNIIFNENNLPVKILGVSQDITDRKKMEIELENYNQKLKEEIAKQTLELTIANKNLDAFNFSISHDMKTPIRGMEMYIQLLRECLKDEESLEYVKKIDAGIHEMKDMISALLDFSKYSKIELQKETIDMHEKINKCINAMNCNTAKIKFIVLDTPPVKGDHILIKNVLDNLIYNAVKYSSKKTESIIEISGTLKDDYVTYYIKDNGAGFDKKLQEKLFKPFSRLHNENEFEGNGFGLAIVERIITRHGGTVWAESEKGKGATFYFKLPNH